MILTKQMIEDGFIAAMLLLYEFHIERKDRRINPASSPINEQDITSRFSKDEFERIAEPHITALFDISKEYYVHALKIDIAYNYIISEYNRLELNLSN